VGNLGLGKRDSKEEMSKQAVENKGIHASRFKLEKSPNVLMAPPFHK
jgi:hypothetical protein